MPCFFCSSLYHLSHSCDVYVSHDSRREKARSKNCCENCLSDDHIQCFASQECCNCFKKYHHTAFCPYSTAGSNIFVANIDDVLIPRFYQMLQKNEQFFLALLTPQASKLFELNPSRIYRQLCFTANENYKDRATFRADSIALINQIDLRKLNYIPVFPRISTVLTAYIKMEDCEVSSAEFLLLLSQNVKKLQCSDVKFDKEIEFIDILEKIPNVLRIKLYKTDISYDTNWFGKYLEPRNVEYLKQLKIDTDKLMFDGEIDCGNVYEKRI